MAKSFMVRTVAGELVDPIDEFYAAIDAYHQDTSLPVPTLLHDYLGMTADEYRRACGPGSGVHGIIAARKASRPTS